MDRAMARRRTDTSGIQDEDKPTIHFEAPPRSDLAQQMMVFIGGFNQSRHNRSYSSFIKSRNKSFFWFCDFTSF